MGTWRCGHKTFPTHKSKEKRIKRGKKCNLCRTVFSCQWILRHLSAALCPPSVLPNNTAILHLSKICLLDLKCNEEREEIYNKICKIHGSMYIFRNAKFTKWVEQAFLSKGPLESGLSKLTWKEFVNRKRSSLVAEEI
jgi:hypothetical protein